MCPWKVDVNKKSDLSKRFIDSIVSGSILLFVEKLYLDDTHNKVFTRSASQWFNKVLSRLRRLKKFRPLFRKQYARDSDW